MKKSILSASLLSAVLLATLMLSVARGSYPGPDYYTRCVHHGNFNTPGDTWTGLGIKGTYGALPPAYVAGDWYFQRGYGGQGSHLYVTDSPFVCVYQYGDYSYMHYEYGTPTRQNRYVPGYGYVDAWYQDGRNTTVPLTLAVILLYKAARNPISAIHQLVTGGISIHGSK
jgi:hypothetical protein